MEEKRIFTFWEPKEKMPKYLKQCIKTWNKFLPDYEIVILDYKSLNNWLPKDYYDDYLYKKFSLPVQADAIRCAILKEYGGIWMDADTIITSDNIKNLIESSSDVTLIGHSICFIKAKQNCRILQKWQQYIFKKILFHKKHSNILTYIFNNKFYRKINNWDYLGNSILNHYISTNDVTQVNRIPIEENYIMPEKVWIKENNIKSSRIQSYRDFYFYNDYSDYVMKNTKGLLCLHNSWTPKQFRNKDFSDTNNTITKLLKQING